MTVLLNSLLFRSFHWNLTRPKMRKKSSNLLILLGFSISKFTKAIGWNSSDKDLVGFFDEIEFLCKSDLLFHRSIFLRRFNKQHRSAAALLVGVSSDNNQFGHPGFVLVIDDVSTQAWIWSASDGSWNFSKVSVSQTVGYFWTLL